jgi:hypothetical protein
MPGWSRPITRAMRPIARRLSTAAIAALVLCPASLTASAVPGNGDGNANTATGHANGGSDNSGTGNAGDRPTTSVPSTGSAAPATPPGQAKKPTTPPGHAATTPGATPATPASGGSPATPATPAKSTTPMPMPVPAATTPVVGEAMGLALVQGTVQVRLPGSTGYAPLAAAGSVPSGAIVDARAGTIVLRTAIDGKGHTQVATIRGAIFEVRLAADGGGMTELVLREGHPRGCRAAGAAAVARAATTHAIPTKSNNHPGGLSAQDRHGRFRTRGRNSVATVRGTRWVTRETCAGTLTRVIQGAVDVLDQRRHRTVRVRAGHSYLARTSR